MSSMGSQGIWKYAQYLPSVAEENRITLGEGHTPLIPSVSIGKELGLTNLYFKLESLNPTGSYKDRISALALSLAKQAGKTACIGTTSGNAGASLAAYAARAGLPYYVYVQENIIPAKLEQIVVHQAKVFKVKGMGYSPEIGTKVFEMVREKAERNNWEPAITAFAYAPKAMEAVKTIAWDIQKKLGFTPDAVFSPVGGGGLFSGIYYGFRDLLLRNSADKLPRMVACQSAGCSNLVRGYNEGLGRPASGSSTSLISGIQVPSPPDASIAFEALRESNGFGEVIEDTLTWKWQEELAAKEGIYAEPAGAIALASVVQAMKAGKLNPHDKIVCIVSGAGYKDVDRQHNMVAPFMDLPLHDLEQLLNE
ncbi:pyridoxal-phosphate dependent enzyme [Paenibacillus sp. IITD108]|uniref:pyridoxal-phosphate dependent enzyme n=1 Tax=Paenibacillus sp. IITD108 TaxID=3116649 RepID=UPI002F429BB2